MIAVQSQRCQFAPPPLVDATFAASRTKGYVFAAARATSPRGSPSTRTHRTICCGAARCRFAARRARTATPQGERERHRRPSGGGRVLTIAASSVTGVRRPRTAAPASRPGCDSTYA